MLGVDVDVDLDFGKGRLGYLEALNLQIFLFQGVSYASQDNVMLAVEAVE